MFPWHIAALLFHQLGTLGLFFAIGLDWLSTTHLRRVQTIELARLWATVMQPLALIYAVSEVFLLTTGIFLVQTAWGWSHAWIDLSLGATLALAVIGTAVGGSRLQAIRRHLASLPGGPLPASLEHQTRDPVLLICVRTLALLSFGIVVLMVVKPASWWSCIGVLLGAVLLGLIAAVPACTMQRRDAA